MPIHYTWTGNYNHEQIAGQIERGIEANLKAAALIWHGSIVRLLRGQKAGRTYFVPGTGGTRTEPITVRPTHPRYKVNSYVRNGKKRYGVTYQASRPGEPPAQRLGELRTNYRFIVRNNEAQIGSPTTYSLYLEKGTSKMAPRPHIKPGFEAQRGRIISTLEKNVI